MLTDDGRQVMAKVHIAFKFEKQKKKKVDLYIRMMSKIALEHVLDLTTCHRDKTDFQILGLGQCPTML